MKIYQTTLFHCLVILFLFQSANALVQTFPEAYDGVLQSDKYEVTVIQQDQSYPTFVYMSNAATEGAGADKTLGQSISWTNFNFTGTVFVEVKAMGSLAGRDLDVTVYPARFGLEAEKVAEDTFRIQISHAGQYVVSFGDTGRKHGLVIAADPWENDRPNLDDPSVLVCDGIDRKTLEDNWDDKRVLYFKPGTHELDGEVVLPPHIREVYLEGGSVVFGAFQCNYDNVKFYGRGMISGLHMEWREDHSIESPSDVSGIIVDGIAVSDFVQFAVRLLGSDNAIRWTKCYGAWRFNNDGFVAWQRSTMEHSFIHADDDAIKLYDDDVVVNDVVIWMEVNGAALQLGWESLAAKNVSVKNVDIVFANWQDTSFNPNLGVINLRLPSGRGNVSENFRFENIYVDTPVLKFIDIRMKDMGEGKGGGRHKMKDYNFKNIHVKQKQLGTENNRNAFMPWDDEWNYENFVFEDFYVNGVKITNENAETDGMFTFGGNSKEAVTFK